MRDERIHVGAILRERIFVGVSQAATLTTPDEIRADDASPCCGKIGSEIIEIASLAGKPMNADYRGARSGRAPIYVR
jgi:hypothetical protein